MIRSIYFSLFARGMLVLVSLAIFKLLTTLLSVEEVGKWSLLIMSVNLFSMALVNPICMYVNRHFHGWLSEGSLFSAMNLTAMFYVVVAMLSSIIFWIILLATNFNWGIPDYWLVVTVLFGVFVMSLNQNTVYYINMIGEHRLWFYLSLLSLITGLVFSIWLVLENRTAENWVLGNFLGLLIIGMLAHYFLFKSIKRKTRVSKSFHINQSMLKELLLFSFPLFLAVGLYWIQYQSYRILIADTISMTYLGMFVAGYTVSSGIMGAFESVLQQYFHPIFYGSISHANESTTDLQDDYKIAEAWNELSEVTLPLIFLTAVTIAALSKPLIHILVDEKFWGGWYFVVLGAFVEMFRVMGNVFGLAFHALKKTKYLLLPHAFGALGIAVGMPVSIYLFNENGVMVSMIFSSLVYLYVLRILIKKKLKIKKLKILNITGSFYILIASIIFYIYLELQGNIIWDLVSVVLMAGLYLLVLSRLIGEKINNLK